MKGLILQKHMCRPLSLIQRFLGAARLSRSAAPHLFGWLEKSILTHLYDRLEDTCAVYFDGLPYSRFWYQIRFYQILLWQLVDKHG